MEDENKFFKLIASYNMGCWVRVMWRFGWADRFYVLFVVAYKLDKSSKNDEILSILIPSSSTNM
jgi:hypothetical protein